MGKGGLVIIFLILSLEQSVICLEASGVDNRLNMLLPWIQLYFCYCYATGMVTAPSSVKATVAAQVFSLLKQWEKRSCLSGFGGKERNLLLRFLLANISIHVAQPCKCTTAQVSLMGLHQRSCAVPGDTWISGPRELRRMEQTCGCTSQTTLRALKPLQSLVMDLQNPISR